MESLGYIFIYLFCKGKLFDDQKKFTNKDEKLKFYEDWKLSLIPEHYSKCMPQEFINYLNYVKSLNISDVPEYETWQKIFRNILHKMQIHPNDLDYEW